MKKSRVVETTRIESDFIEEIDSIENERITDIKGIGSFFKKGALVFGLFISIILVSSLYDIFYQTSLMLNNAPIFALIYIVLILAFISIVGYMLVKQIVSYKKIKQIDTLQQQSRELKKDTSKDVFKFAKEVIDIYKNHQNGDIALKAKELLNELDSMMEDEVLERLEEKLLKPLDRLAKDVITKYSTQTAISTAISPVAIIDAILILSRSYVMIFEIAKIYGFRPSFLGEVILFKRVFATLAFASVTDILANHSHDLFGTSLLSKLSIHSAQGIANGILVARIGVGVIRSCRPIEYKDRGNGLLENISKRVVKILFKKDK